MDGLTLRQTTSNEVQSGPAAIDFPYEKSALRAEGSGYVWVPAVYSNAGQ
jgi:hypothetical protein